MSHFKGRETSISLTFQEPVDAKPADQEAPAMGDDLNQVWYRPCLTTRYALEHRMDGLNRSSRAPRSEFSELISGGLILWRLSTAGQSDLWCLVFEHPDGFCFVLDDAPEATTPYMVCEQRSDIVGLVHRAEALKDSLLKGGWVDVEVE